MSSESASVDTLVLSGIGKRFGATAALDDVSLRVRKGTVHALLGENGAGKTTLMRVAFGLVQPDTGRIHLEGRSHERLSTAGAIAAGVGMVHQHFTNVGIMTVAENVALGATGMYNVSRAHRAVVDITTRTGLPLDPAVRAEDLSVGGQQRLEIVKALARNARTLILDEPTAVLAPAEAKELLEWLRRFSSRGNAVVLITHKLREALAIADDVTVLRRGRVAMSAPASHVTSDSLAAAMLGEELQSARQVGAGRMPGPVVASAQSVTIRNRGGATTVRDATFDVRSGEMLGIAAVEGAGQRELLRMLAGRMAISSGTLSLPTDVGFVPEDRHRDALLLDFPPSANVALRGAGSRRGTISWTHFREKAAQQIRDFEVQVARAEAAVRTLSGGNQQKLILARELDGPAALLVVENPTRGLDVRATRDVHARLRRACASGAGVVIYSSDLDEMLALATRVLVMYGGNVRECGGDRDTVGRAMLGEVQETRR